MKILIIENSFSDLKKSRLNLGNFLSINGFDVLYACPSPKKLEGYKIFNLPMQRKSINPLFAINSIFLLRSILLKNRIDIVLSFRLYPNFLNFFSSFLLRNLRRVGVITGLGIAFTSKNFFLKYLIKAFYRMAVLRLEIIAQNKDDLKELSINGKVIQGSGIRDPEIAPKNSIENQLNFLFVGRLLKTKGIYEAIKIFNSINNNNFNNKSLKIAGDIDTSNPDSITLDELNFLKKNKGVKFLGHVNNIEKEYYNSNIFLYPSSYREGVPRAIIEALSYGLTIITKDMPGCKETVRENGFLYRSFDDIDLISYLNNINTLNLNNNSKKSIELFKNRFSSKIIFKEFLNFLNKTRKI